MDINLLKDKGIVLYCLVNFVGILGFHIPIIFSSDRAVQYGVSKERAALLLLSIMGKSFVNN